MLFRRESLITKLFKFLEEGGGLEQKENEVNAKWYEMLITNLQ